MGWGLGSPDGGGTPDGQWQALADPGKLLGGDVHWEADPGKLALGQIVAAAMSDEDSWF